MSAPKFPNLDHLDKRTEQVALGQSLLAWLAEHDIVLVRIVGPAECGPHLVAAEQPGPELVLRWQGIDPAELRTELSAFSRLADMFGELRQLAVGAPRVAPSSWPVVMGELPPLVQRFAGKITADSLSARTYLQLRWRDPMTGRFYVAEEPAAAAHVAVRRRTVTEGTATVLCADGAEFDRIMAEVEEDNTVVAGVVQAGDEFTVLRLRWSVHGEWEPVLNG